MSIYATGTRLTIPEGNWVRFEGSLWGRVLADTPAVLVADAEIEDTGRVAADVQVGTSYEASVLSEDGQVQHLPAGSILTLPAGTTILLRDVHKESPPTVLCRVVKSPSGGTMLLWLAGAFALGVATSYLGSMMVMRRYGGRGA